MNLSFENKVALVTEAASGMGLATAKAFAEAGAAVVLADFKEEVVTAKPRSWQPPVTRQSQSAAT
jgi:NAD(P)-dependent dehydrogenase (short-subunit alcohol dehydrogenase family)